jgi:RNA polymerase primary sigma factor
MTRAIIEQGRTIRLPVHMAESMARLSRCSRQLVQKLGREPVAEELAKAMEVPVEKVRMLQANTGTATSLDAPISDEDDTGSLCDFVEDRGAVNALQACIDLDMKKQTRELLSSLNARERRILRQRFGLEDGQTYTLTEVGQELQLTRERIRQIEVIALRKLRGRCTNDGLASFITE